MPAAPSAPSRTGEPIPGYTLRERIGAGGYGEVWAAEAPGGLVKAIKFVYGQMDEARAAREFKSLSLIKGVRHPFLLSLERIEVIDGQLLIVSELADGSLKDVFERYVKDGCAGIPRDELLDHLRDAADALDYMNSQHSLQHLDVKPENLLLVGGRIKVADFGLVKELHDVSGSLMGGLTPIYAPPEVFDARPSRRSDQYSLAIVYQEMLTGLLPFPGRTAAQLAAQHMTAKPQLHWLPAGDQPVIEKALSKSPEKRFGSCREMVEALLHARPPEPAHQSQASDDGAQSMRATAILDGSPPAPAVPTYAYVPGQNPLESMLGKVESAERAVNLDAQGRYDAAEQAAERAVLMAPPPASLADMPPLEVDLTGSPFHPTLLVGVGGLGGKTLQQLRRKLADKCTREDRENFQYLLIDTDGKELAEATHGELGSAFGHDEALNIPIRKSTDYRNDSRKFLDWLSRRWLFNIPRSHQTEGVRPFGRLAFVDHSEAVMKSLRAAVSRLAAVKTGDEQPAPRVVIVASSSGGAAGGMVADLVFAIRQIMDEQKLGGAIDLLLLHSTGRQPAAQELAAVNSFALLTELHHVLQPGGYYPGELSCGIKARSASEPALRSIYLAHMGQELSADQFLHGCKQVAEYLLLDLATPAGTYLNACRAAEPKEPVPGVTVRSFGLCQIGFSEAAQIRGVESLSQAVVLRWFGEPKPQTNVLSAKIAELSPTTPASPTNARDAELDALALGEAKVLGLDLDSLVQRLYIKAAEDMEGNPEGIFARIISESAAGPGTPPPIDKWFAGSARYFGAKGSEAEAGVQSPLHAALMKKMTEIIAFQGEQLREWLLALPDLPAARVYGAQWCAKWFRTHLKGLADKATQTRSTICAQLSALEARISAAARTPPKAAVKDPANTPDKLFLQHCQFRMYHVATHVANHLAQSLMSYAAQASEQLVDFGRDLKHLAGQFSTAEVKLAGDLDNAALHQLQLEEERAVIALDKFFQDTVFSKESFRAVFQVSQRRNEIVALLKQMARQSVLETLSRIDLMAIVKELAKPGVGGKVPPLAKLIAGAQPWLQQVGGDRRLLCISGQSNGSEAMAPSAVSGLISSAYFEQLPAVIPASIPQVVFCYELGNVPLAHAAAKLIDNRPDYAQAASRLHTRCDLSWQELPI